MAALFFVALVPGVAGAEHSCDQLDELKSHKSHKPSRVQFLNGADGERLVKWLDFHGTPVTFKRLKPNQSILQSTYIGHPWMVTDRTGKCREIVVPTQKSQKVKITR